MNSQELLIHIDSKMSKVLDIATETKIELACMGSALSALQADNERLEAKVKRIESKQDSCPARKKEESEEMNTKTWSKRSLVWGMALMIFAALPGWVALIQGCSVIDDDKAGEKPPPAQVASYRDRIVEIRDTSLTWAERRGGAAMNDPDHDASTGDALLFDGLLCFAGIGDSCQAVRDSQGPDGRFWRSPEWVGKPYGSGSTFSRDMALGALAGILRMGDKPVAESWGSYVRNSNYRLCPDERNCKLASPIIWSTFRHVFDAVGAARFGAMWAAKGWHEGLAAQAKVAPVGYQLHLTGVHVLLLQAVGISKPTTSQILANRQPKNPFFAYLNGEISRSADLTIELCPLTRPTSRQMWQWEREIPNPRPELQSGGWDCVFMASILLNSQGLQ